MVGKEAELGSVQNTGDGTCDLSGTLVIPHPPIALAALAWRGRFTTPIRTPTEGGGYTSVPSGIDVGAVDAPRGILLASPAACARCPLGIVF